MEEPEQILQRIMNFEKQYTPQFNDLIKQSLSDNISNGSFDIDDDPENDPLPKLPESNPLQKNSVSDTQINGNTQQPISSFFNNHNNHNNHNTPNLSNSTSQPTPNSMPSWSERRKKSNHRHKETPIMQRAGSSQNSIKLIDQNSFIITDDLQYNSEEDSDDDHFITKPTQNANDNDNEEEDGDDGSGSVKRYESDEEEDEFEEDEPLDPLIEEYESVSHEIHRSKLKLRKLDRQMTIAQRQGTSQSDFVKQHSDIKIKIAQLISKRRELESHDVVRAHIKEEDTPTVEIGGSGGLNAVMDNDKQSFMEDGGLMEINEDEEEEDEVVDNVNNNISPQGMRSDSDGNYDEDRLKGFLTGINGYNENEQSKTIDSMTSNDMDHFDYAYDAEVVVKEEMDEEYEETGSVQFHSDEDEDGGGSVQYHSSPEDEEVEESDGGGSMQMNPDIDNREDWMDEDEENGGYEDEDESGGGGSVQLNDVENNENWVDDEFDNKSIEIRGSDDEENDGDDMKHIEDIKDEDSKEEEKKDKLEDNDEEEKHEMNVNSVRRRRLEQMKRHKNYKTYGSTDNNQDTDDLDALRAKYQESRRQREQIEIDGPFSVNLLTKAENGYDAITDLQRFGNQIPRIVDDDDDEEDKNNVEYDEEDDDDDDYPIPVLPGKKKSVLLDIEQFASNLAAVIEEEDDDEDDSEERNFRTVEYQTDSDCDSNDSVVVKREIYKEVTVNDLQQFDTV